jgi:hypothetical protein
MPAPEGCNAVRARDAFFSAMRMSRKRRIGPRETEQLLNADPDGFAYPELRHVLAAAAAPPRPHELAGLRAAVAEFESAGRYVDAPRTRAARRSPLTLSVGMKVAAGVAVVLFGGTAVAAETGNLPGGAQQQAHDLFSSLGVPPPAASPTAGATPEEDPTTPAPAPSASDHGRKLDPTSPAVLGLCRAWEAQQQNPKDKPMPAEARRDLAAAAGGERHLAAFCAPLLAGPRQRSVAPTPSHQGGGRDHDRHTPTPRRKG